MGKTPAVNTDWTDRPLVTMKEFKRRSSIIKEEKNKVRRQDRAKGTQARRLIGQHPDDTNEVPDEEADGIATEADIPHHSHDLKRLRSDPKVVFCNSCGQWSRDQRHSKLSIECQLPIKPGNKKSLRLLQCDIRPSKGATIPLNMQNIKFRPKGPTPPES